ncbi:hypothetical protein [Streptomyces sp. LaPpAH-108]|uniref:hypothetical protein n=1 Tax=Streptomyces sp. LaPpAH-108 TaxID=1155714 RepID=UPI00039A4610|nr:hypothetical protein [Streptomyces sp. LaPpAH-108]
MPQLPMNQDLLITAVRRFAQYKRVDEIWHDYVFATAGRPDLAEPAHRKALLRWLNAAGCRIRYPKPGEPDPFDEGLAAWWRSRGADLPHRALAELTDADTDALGDCFTELAGTPAALSPATGRVRALGPTAAAKALHALRPHTLMPWDEAIAAHLHGARDGAAYAAHQRLGRDWAARLLSEARLGPRIEDALAFAEVVGRPARPLPKMLDDYCYLAITAGAGPTPT